MSHIQERGSTHVYKVNKISKAEIDSMVRRCVYENPPFCSAACPLKLDTRAFLKAAADGDFKKALLLYEKIAPFPLILASGCEAPCEAKCRLGEIGDSVAIRDVEAAVARFGVQSRLGGVFRSRKKKTVAIFGSGLFPLFLAGEIEKKAYPLTAFCEEENLEQFLRKETGFLPEDAFKTELGRLRGKDIQFEFNCTITGEFFAEKRQQLYPGPGDRKRSDTGSAHEHPDDRNIRKIQQCHSLRFFLCIFIFNAGQHIHSQLRILDKYIEQHNPAQRRSLHRTQIS